MSEPTTEAGKALAADYPGLLGLEYGRTGEPIIAAIEAEAVAAERKRLAEEVRRLPPHGTGHGIYVWRAAVLALLEAGHE